MIIFGLGAAGTFSIESSEMETVNETMEIPKLFVYTADDIQRIMSGALGDRAFLNVPAKVDVKRNFEFARQRKISLELHLSLLSEYYKAQIIPRGLRSHLRPNLFPKNHVFCARLEGLSNKYALDVILLNIEFLQLELTTLETDICNCELKFKDTLDEADFTTYMDKTQKILTKFRHDQEELKRHKWFRDTEDYKKGNVYSWQKDDNKDERRSRQREKPQRRRFQNFQNTQRRDFSPNVIPTDGDFLGVATTTPTGGGGNHDEEGGSTTERVKTRSDRNGKSQAPQKSKN